MRIYHLALLREWEQALACGSYRTSTLGVSLEQEGFLHASHEHQWEGVRAPVLRGRRGAAGAARDRHRPASRSRSWRRCPPGADQAFPHVYGPLATSAVVEVRPLDA